ncbi:AMP-binding protein [Sphingobium sp. EM0848]|uniref:AMP-binding protein n=1 Tax=Sphingobium sp. EM0848 TaxID=2743473 RepID=UPI00159CBE2C
MILLPELFDYWAKFRPDKDAIVCEDTRYSWSQLVTAARALAATLQARGIKPGDRVAILLGNCAEWAVAYAGLTVWLRHIIGTW